MARARTELMFQEAILSLVTTGPVAHLFGGVKEGPSHKEGLFVSVPRTDTKRPLLRGHGARADQAFVTQGDRRMTRVTGGNPGDATI